VPLNQGTVVAGRFQLVRELGRGGMGAVWRAHHLGLNAPCAIKLMIGDAAGCPDTRARFEAEAHVAAQLRSPYVVQILDYGVWEETPYIVMELLEGEDLDQRLARLGRLDPREVARIARHLSRALAKAHAAGLIHRDLKPANVFLTIEDDAEVAKILDFGIARQTRTDLAGPKTKTGVVLGTPYYMSPEQARGTGGVDYRSDLWSLGVIVFRCMTGRLPFQSRAFGELLIKIMFSPLPVPSQVAPVPEGFDAWWARATAREPEARFQSAREMADALEKVVESAPSAAAQAGASCSSGTLRALTSHALTSHALTSHALASSSPDHPSTEPDGPRRSRAWIGLVAASVVGLGAGIGIPTLRDPSPAAPPAAAPQSGADAAAVPLSVTSPVATSPVPAAAATSRLDSSAVLRAGTPVPRPGAAPTVRPSANPAETPPRTRREAPGRAKESNR
jgi:serine/threonine-protein kinase